MKLFLIISRIFNFVHCKFLSDLCIFFQFAYFFYVLCPFKMLAFMALHGFLFFVALNKLHIFVISPKHCSATSVLKLPREVMHCFPLSLQSILCVSNFPWFLPHYFNSLFLVLSVSVLLVSISLWYSQHISVELDFICFKSLHLWRVSSIHSHVGGLIFHDSSVLFPLFIMKFSCLNTLLSVLEDIFCYPNVSSDFSITLFILFLIYQ